MKRLIDSEKLFNFKNWVIQHNPKLKWNFSDPQILKSQLVATIKESGDLDIKSIFYDMFTNDESGLTIEQNDPFLESDY